MWMETSNAEHRREGEGEREWLILGFYLHLKSDEKLTVRFSGLLVASGDGEEKQPIYSERRELIEMRNGFAF